MALTPLKAFLFLAGGTTAAAATAYVSGALDPYFMDRPAAIAAVPETTKADAKDARLPAPDASAPGASGSMMASTEATAPADAMAPADTMAPAGATAPADTKAPAGTMASDTAMAPATTTVPPPADSMAAPAADAMATTTAEPSAGVAPQPSDAAAGQMIASAAPDEQNPAAMPQLKAPSFDIVRVESNGSIVIAGKAAPNAKVEIISGATVIGSTVAGPDGDFAIVLDDPLKPGDYQLVLRSTAPGNIVATSPETAVVSIPETEDGQVLALVEKPGAPSKLITVPQPEATAKPAAEANASGGAAPEAPAAPSAADQQAAVQPAAPAVAATTPAPSAQAESAVAPKEARAAPAAANAIKIAVEAVEIEGRKIFVAGIADPGRKVRAYANEILLGDAKTSPSGRFLVEAERDLPVGDYIVRVDALEPDGVKVVARAAVPFEREAGESIAAVAPAAPAEPKPATGETTVAAAEPSAGLKPAVPESNVAAAEPIVAPKPAASEINAAAAVPSAEQTPAATENNVAAAESAAVKAPDTASGPPQSPEVVSPAVNQQPAAVEAGKQPTLTENTVGKPAAEAGAAPAQPAEEAAAPAIAPAVQTDAAAQVPAETMSPKLQNVKSAVIIRRGDTLWRISRRVYGFGTRYSTIYLANQEQISDPDRIWPGQVFKVPDQSKEGEAADMTTIGEQATTTAQ